VTLTRKPTAILLRESPEIVLVRTLTHAGVAAPRDIHTKTEKQTDRQLNSNMEVHHMVFINYTDMSTLVQRSCEFID